MKPGRIAVTAGSWLSTVLTMMATGLVSPHSAVAAQPAAASGPAVLGEESARAMARRAGQPVEVTSLTTEWRRVYARPGGDFVAEVSVEPVRARRSGQWVPIDLNLHDNGDGTVTPAASTVDIAFSGGGSGPLVRLGQGRSSLALHWPGRLPAPELSGEQATYREIVPDVDLILRAASTGFSQLLVVKSAKAAANPALRKLRMALSTAGLSVRTGERGDLAAVDDSGAEVFVAPAPYMWDSSGAEDAARVPGGRVRQIQAQVGSGEFSLVPDQSLLDDPGTRFPVYIDPSWSGARLAQTQVWTKYKTTSFFNGANFAAGTDKSLRVGYDATDKKITRSFFRLDTSAVKGKHILSATLRVLENHAWSCSPRQVEVWATGPISTATTWNNQPTWIEKVSHQVVAKGYSSSCPDGGLEFNVTPQVVAAAARNANDITQGMRASATAERNSDTYSWKKFDTNPVLVVNYNTVPDVPANLTTEGSTTCAQGADRLAIGTTTPTLRATVSDADNAVMGRFEWWALDGTAAVGSWTSAVVASRTNLVVKVPSGAFADGALGRWRVRAEDGVDVSAWSPWCEFHIDAVRPNPPLATSPGFPVNGVGNAVVGVGLPVTLWANESPDVIRYEYGLNTDPGTLDRSVATTAPGGSAGISVIPDQYVNWLHVRSVDSAGNLSDLATFTFYAAAAPGPVGEWNLDETGDLTRAVDTSGRGRHAALGGSAQWTTGRRGGALSFNGSSAYAATTTPVLDTTRSFSVSAWVRLSAKAHNEVVVSQAGSRGSSFALLYSSGFDRWVFNATASDVDAPPTARAISTTVPVVNGDWVHLAGVHDAVRGELRLYVDGVLEAVTPFTTPWNATGPLHIGRQRYAGGFVGYFAGEIDDVQVHDRALFPGELRQVSRLDGRWTLDETSGRVAGDTTGRHPATWSATGVTRVSGVSGGAVRLDGVTGALTASGPAVRTDGSFTVMAWIRPSSVTADAVALSQSGSTVAAFNLGYSFSQDFFAHQWSVRTCAADAADSPSRVAADLFDPVLPNVWTHVTAVYDAATRQLRLYVDGQAVAQEHHASNWNALGAFVIGAGRVPGAATALHLAGDVDDVRAYAGVLTDQEIFRIVNGTE